MEFERHPQFELFDLRREVGLHHGDIGLGGDVPPNRRAQCGDDGFGQPLVYARILEPLYRRVCIKGQGRYAPQ